MIYWLARQEARRPLTDRSGPYKKEDESLC